MLEEFPNPFRGYRIPPAPNGLIRKIHKNPWDKASPLSNNKLTNKWEDIICWHSSISIKNKFVVLLRDHSLAVIVVTKLIFSCLADKLETRYRYVGRSRNDHILCIYTHMECKSIEDVGRTFCFVYRLRP